MRQVSIRQLRGNLSNEMLNLPFEVTNRGVVIGVMCTQEGLSTKAEMGECVHKVADQRVVPKVFKKEFKPQPRGKDRF